METKKFNITTYGCSNNMAESQIMEKKLNLPLKARR